MSWWEIVFLLLLIYACVIYCKYVIPQKKIRIIAGILLVIWGVAFLDNTLLSRTPGEYTCQMELFHSYRTAVENKEVYRANFMNMLLFFPAGLLFVQILPGRWKYWQRSLLTVFVLGFSSVVIEFSQYYFQLGICEIDDVFHNTLGVLFGSVTAMTTDLIMNSKKSS